MILLIHTGHLENVGSLSFTDLRNVHKFHYILYFKKSCLLVSLSILSVLRYWEAVELLWQTQIFQNPNLHLKAWI